MASHIVVQTCILTISCFPVVLDRLIFSFVLIPSILKKRKPPSLPHPIKTFPQRRLPPRISFLSSLRAELVGAAFILHSISAARKFPAASSKTPEQQRLEEETSPSATCHGTQRLTSGDSQHDGVKSYRTAQQQLSLIQVGRTIQQQCQLQRDPS